MLTFNERKHLNRKLTTAKDALNIVLFKGTEKSIIWQKAIAWPVSLWMLCCISGNYRSSIMEWRSALNTTLKELHNYEWASPWHYFKGNVKALQNGVPLMPLMMLLKYWDCIATNPFKLLRKTLNLDFFLIKMLPEPY